MTTITPAALEQYQIETNSTPEINKELGQDEFLELMTAQLKHQDPMKPMDNGEFLGQMAQFSTVTGIEEMQQSLDTLASTYANSQTLQTTQLVGQEVLIENSQMELNSENSTGGLFELEQSSKDVQLDIIDSTGAVVKQITLGEYGEGRHGFQWDGTDEAGNRLPPGTYSALVTAQRNDGYISATVMTNRIVESVEFGHGGESTLNTTQGDILTLADIRQIRKSTDSDITEE